MREPSPIGGAILGTEAIVGDESLEVQREIGVNGKLVLPAALGVGDVRGRPGYVDHDTIPPRTAPAGRTGGPRNEFPEAAGTPGAHPAVNWVARPDAGV